MKTTTTTTNTDATETKINELSAKASAELAELCSGLDENWDGDEQAMGDAAELATHALGLWSDALMMVQHGNNAEARRYIARAMAITSSLGLGDTEREALIALGH